MRNLFAFCNIKYLKLWFSDYTYICTKWILKRNGKYRCGNHKKRQNECKADMNWTITPLIDTNGNCLVLTSDGSNVNVKNDLGASNQRWLLSKELSNSSECKVIMKNIIREMDVYYSIPHHAKKNVLHLSIY